MFPVKIDRGGPLALHDQVAAEIRRAIADGEAGPGERLPLAKDMAAVLGVNKNTVLRALHILRDEGLLDFQRGRGITVAGTPERSAVVKRVRDLVDFCRSQGYRPEEVIRIIEGLAWPAATGGPPRGPRAAGPPRGRPGRSVRSAWGAGAAGDSGGRGRTPGRLRSRATAGC